MCELKHSDACKLQDFRWRTLQVIFVPPQYITNPRLFQKITRVQYTEFVHPKRMKNDAVKLQTQATDISEFYTPLVAIPLYQTWENNATWNSHLSILNLHDKLLNGETLVSLVDPGGTASDAEIHENILSHEIANIQTVKSANGLHRNANKELVQYDPSTNAWTTEVRSNQSFLPFTTITLNTCTLVSTCAKGLLSYKDNC